MSRRPNTKTPPKRKRYHQADDSAPPFDYELPDWLVGAD